MSVHVSRGDAAVSPREERDALSRDHETTPVLDEVEHVGARHLGRSEGTSQLPSSSSMGHPSRLPQRHMGHRQTGSPTEFLRFLGVALSPVPRQVASPSQHRDIDSSLDVTRRARAATLRGSSLCTLCGSFATEFFFLASSAKDSTFSGCQAWC